MNESSSRRTARIAGGIILLGVVLRLVEFLHNRPLWVDEAMLSLSIGTRSLWGLLRPLDYNQTAPPLFLWLVKGATMVGGMAEPVLRSIPLLAGLVFPWVVWRASRALVGSGAALIATTLAAVSPALVYFSAELKPYGSDALVTAAVILLTATLRRDPEKDAHWWRLFAAGVIGFLISTTATFALAGAPLALLADPAIRRSARGRGRWIALATGWAVLGLLIYWVAYRTAAHSPYLIAFWKGTFLDLGGPHRSEQLYTLAGTVLDPLPAPLDLLRIRWWILIFAVGSVMLVRKHGLGATLQVVAPIGALVAASVLGRYPLANRLVVFLAPCVFLLVAVAVTEILSLLRLPEPSRGLLGTILMLIWAAPPALRNVRTPHVLEDGRESARMLLRGDPSLPVYIMPGGLPAWAYYSTDWHAPDRARLAYFARASAANAPGAVNDLLPEAPADADLAPLRFRGPLRTELLGARSGVAYREPGGLIEEGLKKGWAESEVSRMLALGTPMVGMYGAHWTSALLPVLRTELARRGLVATDSLLESEAVAFRFSVPVNGVPASPSRTAPP